MSQSNLASIDADVKVTEELIEQYQEFLAGMATSSLSYCSHFASIKAGLFFGRFSVTKTKSSWQNLEFFDNFLEFFFRKKLEFFSNSLSFPGIPGVFLFYFFCVTICALKT